MKGERRDWVWVFGDIAGLRLVLDRATMAFAQSAAPHLRRMSAGDRAILCVVLSAFHNATRDVARLAGLGQSYRHTGPIVISPKPIRADDFTILAGAIRAFAAELSTT